MSLHGIVIQTTVLSEVKPLSRSLSTPPGSFLVKIPRSDTSEVSEDEVTVTSELLYTHKQKEQRNRKEKRRLHPLEAQTKTQNRRMELKHGGAPLVTDESGCGQRPGCTEYRLARTQDQGKPACARKIHS